MKHAAALTQMTMGYGLCASLAPTVAALPAFLLFVSAGLALARG
jgi:hypothetical protein